MEFMSNGKKYLLTVLSGDSLVDKNLPNDPNPRGFMGLKNKNYSEIKKTARMHPELFLMKNHGLYILAHDYVAHNDGTLSLFFKESDGLINGIHTATVLKKYGRDKIDFIAFVTFDIPTDLLAEVVIASNSSLPQKDYSIANKMGIFKWQKEVLTEFRISYEESDSAELKIDTVLQLAGLFQIDKSTARFIHDNPKKLRTYLRNKNTIVKKNIDDINFFVYSRYILRDIVFFYEEIRKDEWCIFQLKKKLKRKGWVRGGSISNLLMLNIIYSLSIGMHIPKNTLYPCLKKTFDIQKLILLAKSVFPEIVDSIMQYEEDNAVAEICRTKDIHITIQNLMLKRLNSDQEK